MTELFLCLCIFWCSEHSVCASIEVPELDSPKVNLDIGPKAVPARGECWEKDNEGEEGGEPEVRSLKKGWGVLAPFLGDSVSKTVAVDTTAIGETGQHGISDGDGEEYDIIAVVWLVVGISCFVGFMKTFEHLPSDSSVELVRRFLS